MQSNKLAEFFDKQREIIEAAETPFAKLAIFILPILAPSVPASMTGLHVYKLLLGLFTFSYASQVSTVLSITVSVVLELLGYVGAVSFIQSLFRWVRTGEIHYALPVTLNFLAYFFYLTAMYLINYQLGKFFGTPDIVNNIVGLLSFITVPTSLLAANHLSQKEEKEESFQLRQERRQDNLKRYEIKHGNNLESSKKLSSEKESFQESSKKSQDWRKVRPQLSQGDLEKLAKLTPDQMRQYASETGFTYKTISNWRSNARDELGMSKDE